MSVGESRRLRRYLLEGLKWFVAIGLIVVLVKSGRLSFSDIKGLVEHPNLFAICFGLTYLMLLGGFFRWKVLVSALGVRITFWESIKLGMVGQFFSAVIPGTISGDFVKAVFVARRYPDRRMLTVSSVLLDRILGLSALIWVGAVGFLAGLPMLRTLAHPMAPLLRSLGWGLVVVSVLIVLGLAFFSRIRTLFLRVQPERFRKWKLMRSLNTILDGYAADPSILWKMTLFSVIFHASNVFILYQIASAAFGPGPWGTVSVPVFAMVTVMGLCAMSLPIAPMGLGVGQLAFATMFSVGGAPSDSFGASIITAMQILNLLVNLTGGLFYLTYRHQVVVQAPDASV
jgi:uncharacterized protein (TIRG00374 family)